MGKRIQVKDRHYKKLKKKRSTSLITNTSAREEEETKKLNSLEKQSDYDNDDEDQIMKIVKCCNVCRQPFAEHV